MGGSMKNKKIITKDLIKTIESMSHLEVPDKEEAYFVEQFNETLSVINDLNKIDTGKVESTNQVTGLKNVYREDVVETGRILSQDEALSNSKSTHDGFFVVKAILDEK
jgi:aspartyl/glutamyl-tRNA(Asn/Gln) amidotransferase C subunit